jgi:hypothetical protein
MELRVGWYELNGAWQPWRKGAGRDSVPRRSDMSLRGLPLAYVLSTGNSLSPAVPTWFPLLTVVRSPIRASKVTSVVNYGTLLGTQGQAKVMQTRKLNLKGGEQSPLRPSRARIRRLWGRYRWVEDT